jgi:hypothetical protein
LLHFDSVQGSFPPRGVADFVKCRFPWEKTAIT